MRGVRATSERSMTPIASVIQPSHKDVILIRQVLKHANEREWLDRLPPISKSGKLVTNPRPWLNAQEWAKLLDVSHRRIRAARTVRIRKDRQDLDDLMVFLYTSMFCIEEMGKNLRFRDCRVEKNAVTRCCSAISGAARPADVMSSPSAKPPTSTNRPLRRTRTWTRTSSRSRNPTRFVNCGLPPGSAGTKRDSLAN